MPPTNDHNRPRLAPRSASSTSPAILATTLCIVILVPALLFLLLYLKSRKKPKAPKCKGRHVHWYGRCHGRRHGHGHGHYHGGRRTGMAGRRRCHVKSHRERGGCRREEEEVSPAPAEGVEGVAMAGANGGMDMGGMGDMPPMMGDMGDMPLPPIVDGPVMDPGMMWGGLVPPGGQKRGRGRRHCFGRY